MFAYRVVDYFPETQFGIAVCTDEYNARKITVRDKDVISGTLRNDALIECEIERVAMRGKLSHRYGGKKIRVLRGSGR